MPTSDLTRERLKELLHYDSETGEFTHKIRRAGVKYGSLAGTQHSEGYSMIRIDKTAHYAHRLAWLYVYGLHPKQQIDHINGVKADNRLRNLRDVSQSANQQNMKGPRKSKKDGQPLGVRSRNNRFSAIFTINGKQTWIGTYCTADLAHQAYLQAKKDNGMFV